MMVIWRQRPRRPLTDAINRPLQNRPFSMWRIRCACCLSSFPLSRYHPGTAIDEIKSRRLGRFGLEPDSLLTNWPKIYFLSSLIFVSNTRTFIYIYMSDSFNITFIHSRFARFVTHLNSKTF